MIFVVENPTSDDNAVWSAMNEEGLRMALICAYDLDPHASINKAKDKLPLNTNIYYSTREAIEALDDPRIMHIDAYDKLKIYVLNSMTYQ